MRARVWWTTCRPSNAVHTADQYRVEPLWESLTEVADAADQRLRYGHDCETALKLVDIFKRNLDLGFFKFLDDADLLFHLVDVGCHLLGKYGNASVDPKNRHPP